MTDKYPSGAAGDFDDDLVALADLLAMEGIDARNAPSIARRDPSATVPMSLSQELLWLLDRATPGMTAYNMPVARRLRGALDVGALERALGHLTSRHEALRTRLVEVDGVACQVVDAPAPVSMQVLRVDGASESDRLSAAQRAVRARARHPFDLAHEHAFRVTLLTLSEDDHVLVLETHHIAVDGWSLGILYRELQQAYAQERAGRQADLPPVTLQYGDYAIWQREQLAGERLEALLSFWRSQLGAATDPLALPTDYPRPHVQSFDGAREAIVLDAELLAQVMRVAHAHDATLYMVLLAAYATVLHRYTGRANVLVGSGSAGRTQHEMEQLVGYLNNTLVQRADFSGDPTFGELLGRVRASALDAYDHQDIPLEKLVLELRQGDARLGDAPLFEVVLTMQDTIVSTFALEGLTVEPFGADLGATKFDVTLLVAERDGALSLTAQYRSALFAPETMRRFLGHVRAVLKAATVDANARVSALPLLTAEETAQLAVWNDTAVDEGAPATLVELFEAQAARVPDRVAVVGPAPITYAALDARANQLAHRLRALGVGDGALVGLLLDRSADAIVGLLGILKSGGAYVPLSVDAPAARLAQQIGECGAKVVVSLEAGVASLPASVTVLALDRDSDVSALAAMPETNPNSVATPASLAYVLYTSGSTGIPKGVAVTHANAVHYARAVSRVLGDVPATQAGDGFAALDGLHFALASTLAADLGNTSLFPSLLAGATLHVLAKDATTEPARFADYMTSNAVDVLKITPNHLAALTAGKTGRDLANVLPRRWVVLGGEALRPELARVLSSAGGCRVLNHYGPTETTVGACAVEVTTDSLGRALSLGAQTMPIGLPLANMRAFVVDGHGNEQPVSVPGELLLGGPGVARGYLGREDLTAERFTSFRGERVYHTGDRVRRLADGTIEFLGRADDQVKVRGYRVELGEIEQVLGTHSAVAQAVAVLRVVEGAEPVLVTYVVPKQGGYEVAHAERPTSDALREWLATQLPEYMVPSAVVFLEALPLTANGKVDRAKLPSPDASDAGEAYTAPRTETESKLADIWAEVLKKDRVGISDNFLALGGHSLLAIRVLGKISRTLGVRLPLRTLFDAPTIAQLALAVEAEKATAAPAVAIGARSRDAYRVGTPSSAVAKPVDGPEGASR
jgi:amino acid adenylation domain-containing protein